MKLPEPFYKGKVRDLYEADSTSMILKASDRISAFDVVFPDPIPGKGEVLTAISNAWFMALRKSGLQEKLDFTDHIISTDISEFPEPFKDHPDLAGVSVLVKKTKRIDFECVVRGYVAGSAWKEYEKTGTICGHTMPKGLEQAGKLPEPIFTPATKAPQGEHDENVSIEKMMQIAGVDLTRKLEKISIEIYNYAADILSRGGIILCDTKFEFGIDDGKIVLIDEILTPDSSRYWDAARYKAGTNPPGYDKQFIRDHVEDLGWNKKPPAPHLSEDVVSQTTELYAEIRKRIESALK
jgi:phosphoribosylaminoimidazole-succinocarboxamide synthase